MADHGFKNLVWAGYDTGVSASDGGFTISGAGIDVLTVGGLTILPPSIALTLTADYISPDVNVYLQWSKDNTLWAPAGSEQSKALFICNITDDLRGANDETAVYVRSLQARYFRMLYENLTGGGQAVTMQFDWAPIFGETP